MPTRRIFLGLLALFGAAMLLPATAHAQFDKEASALIQKMGDSGVAIVADKQLSEADRRQRFDELFSTNFDVPTIGRFVLGRYWKAASDEQRDEFLKVFRSYIVKVYSGRFSQYSGQTFKVVGTRPEGEDSVIVSSRIISPGNDQPVSVDWRVAKTATGPRVRDVIVEGVSMSITQRDDFGSMISREGGKIDALIAQLKQLTA